MAQHAHAGGAALIAAADPQGQRIDAEGAVRSPHIGAHGGAARCVLREVIDRAGQRQVRDELTADQLAVRSPRLAGIIVDVKRDHSGLLLFAAGLRARGRQGRGSAVLLLRAHAVLAPTIAAVCQLKLLYIGTPQDIAARAHAQKPGEHPDERRAAQPDSPALAGHRRRPTGRGDAAAAEVTRRGAAVCSHAAVLRWHCSCRPLDCNRVAGAEAEPRILLLQAHTIVYRLPT